jgi:hypothetical protein
MQLRRRIQHNVRDTAWRSRNPLGVDIPAFDRRQGRWSQREPRARRLLAIEVAEHRPFALAGEVAGEIGGDGAFPDTSLWIGY